MSNHDEDQDAAGDVAVALRRLATQIDPHPDAWQTLSRGVTRRRRVRRAGGAALALGVAVMMVPAASVVHDTFIDRRGDDVAMAGASVSDYPPMWPLVSQSQITQWQADPIVGIVPDITSAEATAKGFNHVVLAESDAPLAITPQGSDQATAVIGDPGTTTLTLRRFGTQGPWLVTDVTGQQLTIDTPSPGTTVARGTVLSGNAPTDVDSVYVRIFAQNGDQGTEVFVDNGRWSTPVPKAPTGPVSVMVLLQPDDGIDAAASTFILNR